jgi:uncharacterized protein (TIGR02246 family)
LSIDLPADIQRTLDQLGEAWNAADADAFAALFEADASFVIWRGDVLQGREAIEHAHSELFSRSPGQMVVQVTDYRQLTADVAVLLTLGGTGHGEVVLDKVQTLVLSRRDGRWLVAAFHNTNAATDS